MKQVLPVNVHISLQSMAREGTRREMCDIAAEYQCAVCCVVLCGVYVGEQCI